ncbi:regulator of G-protein signaling 8 [Cololabis saira]|uniref:regulator of G-protein signaling 8 n=1 Tax=Cololabis saira TaxID=129043 RepID=UPI002AD33D85|nr:regulator of G-protein signaling 8 [Cololabis saira]
MRRFSSEGSLLDLDFLPWKKVALKSSCCGAKRDSGTYAPYVAKDELDGGSGGAGGPPPSIQEPRTSPGGGRGELTREHSVSVQNLSGLGKQDQLDQNLLRVTAISEGCRAYSDSQLAPDPKGSTESMDLAPSTASSSWKPQNRHHHRARLSAAKVHLRSLFGQSPHSSNSSLNAEQKDSAKERRSRHLFMRQWSQVGHGKKSKISREELEKWGESLNTLLASPTGVSVFGAFLRSEFSEENLQFYLACEQYRNSSSNFSLGRRAKDICATYIVAGAPREVNLDSKTRDLTIELLQAPSHNSLLHAQKRIYLLLDTDCFPRFLQSTIYQSLLQGDDD